jgi:tripartite-type tricarboxylate transporter receptor subunit TctC
MTGRHYSVYFFAIVLAALFVSVRFSIAQPYPNKSVRMIVPFPAGAGADIVARLFARRLADLTAQPFIIENRAGAAANLGAEAVARAAPDGYTLLVAPASLASSQSMYKNLPFALERDFDPIAFLASTPYILVVTPSLPATSVKELILLAKARSGELNYGSGGTGAASHLSVELFKNMAGINLVHVPYKGTISAMSDLMGGRISLMITGITDALPRAQSGQLRALGVASVKRIQLAPDIPTIAESGLPGFEAATWAALVAPSKTSRTVVTYVHGLVTKIGQGTDIGEALRSQGSETQVYTPDQLGIFIKNEVSKWAGVVAVAGIRPE